MTFRPSMPAVEYRQLWSRLGEMRDLDPDNQDLQKLQQAFIAVGRAAGVVSPVSESESASDEAELRADVNWDKGEIQLSAHDAEIIDHVSDVTNVPE